MQDHEIVALYWKRDENAISETRDKYGVYCYTIAFNILYSNEDAEECVNDTYIKAWNTMPPQKPTVLSAFLGKITRNLAINRYKQERAAKRDVRLTEVFCEADGTMSGKYTDPLDEIALKDAINSFLASLSREHRIIFLRRYWYMSSVSEIARDYRIPEGTVKSILSRTRIKFRTHLEKEGIDL